MCTHGLFRYDKKKNENKIKPSTQTHKEKRKIIIKRKEKLHTKMFLLLFQKKKKNSNGGGSNFSIATFLGGVMCINFPPTL